MDYELTLFDRKHAIKDVITKYGEQNFYLSFSGGKDSTILHYLLDMALPNNKIPRVFINTGIEYNDIVSFVKELASKDDRFVILTPKTPIKPMLEKYGYPFKSKEFANVYATYQRSGKTMSVKKFLRELPSNRQIVCPKKLKQLFEMQLDFKISSKCCNKLKKEPVHQYEKQSGRNIAITGMRQSEGGQRLKIQCVLTDKSGKIKKFHPLVKVDNEWEDEFIKSNNIKLCKLYTEYGFKRTGCKFCPYSLDLQEQLEKGRKFIPIETKQAEIIWQPVYKLYKQLNYRLKEYEQLSLFDTKE